MVVDFEVEVKNTFLQLNACHDVYHYDDIMHRQQSDSVLDSKLWRSDCDNIMKLHTEDPMLVSTPDDYKEFRSGNYVPMGDITSDTTLELSDERSRVLGCTTLMLRNIPMDYSQALLLTEINRAGFAGSFDFFYVPINPKSQLNRGFAFVNAGQRFIVTACCSFQL